MNQPTRPKCRIDAQPAGPGAWWIRCYTCDTRTLQDRYLKDHHGRLTQKDQPT